MVDKEVLTNEVCHAVLTRLAFLASSGQKSALESVGVTHIQISRLEKLSFSDVNELLDSDSVAQLDISDWINSLMDGLQEEVPEPYRSHLLHGANNKMMFHFFKASASQCREWREKLTLEKPFRARAISHKKHGEICKALLKHGDYRQLTADALLEVAKTHQVSLCALWKEIEKWEKDSEQENKA